MKQEQYIIYCPWCGFQMTMGKAGYYGKLNTHRIVYRCTMCKSQWANGYKRKG